VAVIGLVISVCVVYQVLLSVDFVPGYKNSFLKSPTQWAYSGFVGPIVILLHKNCLMLSDKY